MGSLATASVEDKDPSLPHWISGKRSFDTLRAVCFTPGSLSNEFPTFRTRIVEGPLIEAQAPRIELIGLVLRSMLLGFRAWSQYRIVEGERETDVRSMFSGVGPRCQSKALA